LGDDPKDIERYQQYAREKSATMAQILKPFPQIIAHLKTFAKLADIVIITSSLNAPVETFLANHELMPPIKSVMGRDTHASKVLKIKQALADYGKTPTEARFVTDSRGDLLEAATCEVPSIAVSWGFQSADHLAKTVPTPEIAQDIPHLFELLSTFANT
jgi:phosphoglycolate phosphatase-like HAD superfamily hydrolase